MHDLEHLILSHISCFCIFFPLFFFLCFSLGNLYWPIWVHYFLGWLYWNYYEAIRRLCFSFLELPLKTFLWFPSLLKFPLFSCILSTFYIIVSNLLIRVIFKSLFYTLNMYVSLALLFALLYTVYCFSLLFEYHIILLLKIINFWWEFVYMPANECVFPSDRPLL